MLRLQSSAWAEEPKRGPVAGNDVPPSVNQSLLVAIDSLQGTLNEEREMIAVTEEQLKREQAQVRRTEERLKKARARCSEIKERVTLLDPVAANEALPGENQALVLAIDSLQGTLNEQRDLIVATDIQLKREQAQVRETEERLKKAQARRLEIERWMKPLMTLLEVRKRAKG
jgi:hypothetical protein